MAKTEIEMLDALGISRDVMDTDSLPYSECGVALAKEFRKRKHAYSMEQVHDAIAKVNALLPDEFDRDMEQCEAELAAIAAELGYTADDIRSCPKKRKEFMDLIAKRAP